MVTHYIHGKYGVPLSRFTVQLYEKLVAVEFPSGVISIYSSLNGGGNLTSVRCTAVFVKQMMSRCSELHLVVLVTVFSKLKENQGM